MKGNTPELCSFKKTITVRGKDESELRLKSVVDMFLSLREVFKKMGRYDIADQIRDNLKLCGIVVSDTKDGYSFEIDDIDIDGYSWTIEDGCTTVQ